VCRGSRGGFSVIISYHENALVYLSGVSLTEAEQVGAVFSVIINRSPPYCCIVRSEAGRGDIQSVTSERNIVASSTESVRNFDNIDRRVTFDCSTDRVTIFYAIVIDSCSAFIILLSFIFLLFISSIKGNISRQSIFD